MPPKKSPKKRKIHPDSQASYLRLADKYLDVGIELVAKALDHVKSAELDDETIAPKFQEAFDKLIAIPPELNGYSLWKYAEKREHQRQLKLRRKRRQRGGFLN